MEHDHSQHGSPGADRPPPGRGWDRKTKWAWIGFALVAGFFLLTEHRAHFFGILPYLLLLACPLMHLFHHRGGHVGGHGSYGSDAPDQSQGEKK